MGKSCESRYSASAGSEFDTGPRSRRAVGVGDVREGRDVARCVEIPLGSPLRERVSAGRWMSVSACGSELLFRLIREACPARSSRLRQAALARAIGRTYAVANRRDIEAIRSLAVVHAPTNATRAPISCHLTFDAVDHGHQGWISTAGDVGRMRCRMPAGTRRRSSIWEKRSSGHDQPTWASDRSAILRVREAVFQLFTFEAELCVTCQEDFLDSTEALEAAGLSE